MKKTDISVIVCSYNRAKMLANALESLIHQKTKNKFSFEIIAVNDKSSDNTNQVIAEITARSNIPIKYVMGAGKGIAAARNDGLKNSSSEWIVFFDDDQLAEPEWLREMYECATKTDAVCIGGVRLLYLSDKKLSQLSSVSRSLLGEINLGMKLKKCKRKEFPAAGNIMLKNSIFEIVGKFDDSLIRGGEDIEFASRIRKSKLGSWYTPKAIVHHVTPEYRTQEGYLIWASLRAGDNFAHRDYLELGLLKTALACLARIGQATLINLPLLLWFSILNKKEEKLARKYLILRTVAYLNRTLNLISPTLFTFKNFFNRLEFRKERKAFQGELITP